MHVAMHALNVAIDASRNFSDRERSGPCHRPDQFPALRRHEPEEQLRRCKTDPRPLFSALECITSATLNIFERCYFKRHRSHFNVSMRECLSRNLLIVSQGLRNVGSAKWVINDYTFDLTPMAHVFGEQLAATECARGGHNRRIPIG